MRFLSLQSHVAYGYVGNRAATFPLQRLGHEVWAVNTVEFSNHTGYGAWRGRTAPADQVAEIVQGIEALGLLPRCDALLTGYVGDAALADVVLDTARTRARRQPQGDLVLRSGAGRRRHRHLREARHRHASSASAPFRPADLVTPNHFELEHLTGRKVSTMGEALAAARSLLKGPRLALITSLRRADAPADQIEMVAVSRGRGLADRHAADRLRDRAQRHGRCGRRAVHGSLDRERRRRRWRSARPLPRSSPCSRPPARWASANCSWWRRRTGWSRRRVASRPKSYSRAMNVPGFVFNPIALADRGRGHRLPDRRAGRPGGGALHPPLDHRRRRGGLHDRHRRGAGRRGVRRRGGLRPLLRRGVRRRARSLAARHRRRRAW